MPADLENSRSQSEHFFRSDERRRIARELHDSTLQSLAALELELGLLKRLSPARTTALVERCEEAIEEIKREIGALGAGDQSR